MVPLSSSAQSPSDLAGGHTHRQSSTLVQQLVPQQFSSDSSLSDSAHKHQSVISGRIGRIGRGRTTFARDQHRLHRPPHPLPCTFTRAAICPRVVGPYCSLAPSRCCYLTAVTSAAKQSVSVVCPLAPILSFFSPISIPIPMRSQRDKCSVESSV